MNEITKETDLHLTKRRESETMTAVESPISPLSPVPLSPVGSLFPVPPLESSLPPVETKQKRIVYLTTCHGNALVKIFEKHPILKNWKHDVYRNFEYIEKGQKFPIDEMVPCDVFIYQPIDGKHRPGYGTDEVVKQITEKQGKQPILISFFYLYFLGYNPDHAGNGQDALPYLSRRMIELSHRTVQLTEQYGWDPSDDVKAKVPSNILLNAGEITLRCQEDSFIPTPFIKTRLNFGFEEIARRELVCSVKILPFIKEHWQTTCLFHTTNHPTNFLLQFISDEVLKQMGAGLGMDLGGIDLKGWDEILFDFVTPILPCVVKTNGIKFSVPPVRILAKEASLEDYVKECIRVYRIKNAMGE